MLVKAARLAQSTKVPAERAAALRQVSSILDGLALYYLPNPAEASLMIEGRPVLALPGRAARDEDGLHAGGQTGCEGVETHGA